MNREQLDYIRLGWADDNDRDWQKITAGMDASGGDLVQINGANSRVTYTLLDFIGLTEQERLIAIGETILEEWAEGIEERPCYCDAYRLPHQFGSGECGKVCPICEGSGKVEVGRGVNPATWFEPCDCQTEGIQPLPPKSRRL